MDERLIGALSGAGAILGLAVIRALPHATALRVQEGAKWAIAIAGIAGGAGFWADTGDPFMLVFAALAVFIWLGLRWRRSRLPLHPERLPPDQ